jgi:hypothetical protein
MEEKPQERKSGFNIIRSNVQHRGFGAGSIDLNNVSSIIIDGDKAYLDMGAMHARSEVEKRIRFSADKNEVPNGRRCWVVWVAVDRGREGAYYAGLAACEMLIDTEARRGWKILADHVNRMDAAMKRKVLVEGLNETEKYALRSCLVGHNAEWWERSPDELKRALS